MELQKEAAGCGVDSLQYWRMTPREIRAAIDGFNISRKQKMEYDLAIYNQAAWLAGQYFGIAEHNPKRYPQKPFEYGEREEPEMTDCDMESWCRAFAQRMND